MQISCITDKGNVRPQNQDYLRYLELNENSLIAVVCDGMGGAKSGDVASSLASDVFVRTVQETFEQDMDQPQIVSMLVHAVKEANRIVFEKSRENAEYAGMGTTLVAALILKLDAYIVNVGDSRCYGMLSGKMSQVTQDHSIVGLMVSRGQITEEEAQHHPNRNLITRAIGTEDNVECDCFLVTMQAGDALLLCSDGLSNLVSSPEMLYEIANTQDGDTACHNLIKTAKHRGAPDNVTVLLIKL